MILPRPFIAYMARDLAHQLEKNSCEFKNIEVVIEAFHEIILEELVLEEEINAEARALLNQYADYIREKNVPYQEMFRKVKRQLLAERKVVSAQAHEKGPRKMKVAREKVVDLSHKLAVRLPRISGTRMIKGWNETRLDIQKFLTQILMFEETIDQKAIRKITSQKRDIPEGSEEWQVLHRRYYDEEMKRLGIDLTPPETAAASSN